ncbi:MAG: twin-arginine translocation signal domain-containing protein, partial [Pseudomonadota bacterium]
MSDKKKSVIAPSRREILKYSGAMALAAPLAAPFVSRAWAQTV